MGVDALNLEVFTVALSYNTLPLPRTSDNPLDTPVAEGSLQVE